MAPKKNKAPKDLMKFVHGKGNVVASWVFGSVLLVILVAITFVLPEPSDAQRSLIRFLMALSAAFLSYFFVGGVILRGSVAGQAVGGGGGFVLFILVQFLVDPFALKTKVADAAPTALSSDETIAFAQTALKKAGVYAGEITGIPDSATREAIKKFQAAQGIEADGYVGARTKQVLTTLGPGGAKVEYELDSAGGLKFISGWSESDVIPVSVPQLIGVQGASSTGTVRFHRIAAGDLQAAFAEIQEKGLLADILTWDGSFVPRAQRSSQRPSIHAYGIAFDINADWNGLGRSPAPDGKKGSVSRLVPIFEKHGFKWGGSRTRPDGMEFVWDKFAKQRGTD